jgi:KDO2-lipid IV(A) lauroyltransferase
MTQRRRTLREAAASGWLRGLFFCARHFPGALQFIRPFIVAGVVKASRSVRDGTRANATRIFGRELNDREAETFARGVVGNFYDFVVDVGRSASQSRPQLLARMSGVDGHDAYVAMRSHRRGAILVTAHMGSFEVGLAALREVEPAIHVVFRRDSFEGFERMRRQMHDKLDVREAPIDEGLPALIRLKDALEANEVVVIQADRAMPGQKAQSVPVLHGHLKLPVGAVRLAQITGAPIVPVFTAREAGGQFRVFLEDAINADPDAPLVEGAEPALRSIGRSIEKFIGRFPEQWLVLNRAFVEDANGEH